MELVGGKTYQLESAPTPDGSYVSVGGTVTATDVSTSETVSSSTPAVFRVRVVQ